MDLKMLEILVCPICKGPLDHDRNRQELICKADRLAFPIRDGMPIMLVEQARDITQAPVPAEPAGPGDAPSSGQSA